MFVILLNLQAEKITREMESKCDQKVAECKEESRHYLMRVQEEHASLVCQRKWCRPDIIKSLIIIFPIAHFSLWYNTNTSFSSLRYYDISIFFFFGTRAVNV